jgi:hypothetical protein
LVERAPTAAAHFAPYWLNLGYNNGMNRQPDDCRATIGSPCVDGPLVGEYHQQGKSFRFDGEERGTYHLRNGIYVWEPDADTIHFGASR